MRSLFKYDDPVYNIRTYLLLGATPEKVNRLVSLLFGINYDSSPDRFVGRALFFTHPEKNAQQVVAFFGRRPEHSTISHEAFHLVEYTMKWVGIPHSKDTSEAWAYLLSFHTHAIEGIVTAAKSVG